MQTQEVINIYMEANPNPNSMKFVANIMLLPAGESLDFPDAESAKHAPLAKKLFELPYVDRVFYMSNFVTITKPEDKDWVEIQNEIKSLIKGHLESGEPILTPEALQDEEEVEKSPYDEKIMMILDEYIKPAVEGDGGAITFHSFKDGVVKVILQGACSGCPSSTVTLKAGIENLLQRMMPEVKEVEAINM
ncbi:NifU family protein [Mangrovivirga cuniculi]|uniref:NifU family protein n=1 Tax=Mangrovivirga cuniculi TaxID=2715131 RepID=A0A4D7JX33_9BACT|nr:NifU family protein [Mangrovivirga cuniculi]QCK13324.1 NifU family protein [Mangrovivirga cuniculi]